MPAQTVRSLNRAMTDLNGYKRVLSQQLDHTYDRLESLERLLRNVRDWFSPYSENRWCTFCAAEVGEDHGTECPYPKWVEEVTYLIGPK